MGGRKMNWQLFVVAAVCGWLVFGAAFAELASAQNFEFHNRVIRLEVDGEFVNAVRSPDGTKVAFAKRATRRNAIFLANTDGTDVIELINEENFYARSPTWSTDGEKILFCARNSFEKTQLFEMDCQSKVKTQLTRETQGAVDPSVSTTGWLAWKVMQPKVGRAQNSMLVIEQGDEKKTVTESPDYLTDHAWSQDGETLAFGSVNRLSFYEVESGKLTKLELPELDARFNSHTPREITWDPEGNEVACRIRFLGGRMGGTSIFGDFEVFRVSVETGEILETISPGDIADYPKEWIRDRFSK